MPVGSRRNASKVADVISSQERWRGCDIITINVEKKHHIFSRPCDDNGRFKTEADMSPQ